jgi:hypothetical protein
MCFGSETTEIQGEKDEQHQIDPDGISPQLGKIHDVHISCLVLFAQRNPNNLTKSS